MENVIIVDNLSNKIEFSTELFDRVFSAFISLPTTYPQIHSPYYYYY